MENKLIPFPKKPRKQLLGFDKPDPKRLQALLDSFDYVAYVPVKADRNNESMFLPMIPQQEQDDG